MVGEAGLPTIDDGEASLMHIDPYLVDNRQMKANLVDNRIKNALKQAKWQYYHQFSLAD